MDEHTRAVIVGRLDDIIEILQGILEEMKDGK